MRVGDESGWTFLEVLAVLGLLGVLLFVTVPQLVVPGTLSANVIARQTAVDLRLAHQLATAMRVYYTLEFNPATPPYTSYTIRNESTLQEEADFPKSLPTEVTVSGRRSFSFAPGGCVDSDLVSPCLGTDGSATVTAGGNSATVWVYWYTGRVKVVQP